MGLRIERRALTKAAHYWYTGRHQGTLGKVRRRGAIGFPPDSSVASPGVGESRGGQARDPEGEEARGASRQKTGHERAEAKPQVWHRGLWESRISVSRKTSSPKQPDSYRW